VTDAVTVPVTVTKPVDLRHDRGVDSARRQPPEVTDAVTVRRLDQSVTTGPSAHLLLPAPSAVHRTNRRTP